MAEAQPSGGIDLAALSGAGEVDPDRLKLLLGTEEGFDGVLDDTWVGKLSLNVGDPQFSRWRESHIPVSTELELSASASTDMSQGLDLLLDQGSQVPSLLIVRGGQVKSDVRVLAEASVQIQDTEINAKLTVSGGTECFLEAQRIAGTGVISGNSSRWSRVNLQLEASESKLEVDLSHTIVANVRIEVTDRIPDVLTDREPIMVDLSGSTIDHVAILGCASAKLSWAKFRHGRIEGDSGGRTAAAKLLALSGAHFDSLELSRVDLRDLSWRGVKTTGVRIRQDCLWPQAAQVPRTWVSRPWTLRRGSNLIGDDPLIAREAQPNGQQNSSSGLVTDLQRLAAAYRDLRVLAEGDLHDHGFANELYFRECQLRSQGAERLGERVLFRLYGWLGGYGVRPVVPLVCLVVLVVLIGVAAAIWGQISAGTPNAGVSAVVQVLPSAWWPASGRESVSPWAVLSVVAGRIVVAALLALMVVGARAVVKR